MMILKLHTCRPVFFCCVFKSVFVYGAPFVSYSIVKNIVNGEIC